jgi:membrane protein
VLESAAEALRVFFRARGRVLGASIAFYSLMSVAPILFIAMRIAGLFARGDDARSTLLAQLAGWVGEDGAGVIGAVVDRQARADGGALVTIVGIALMLYSATRLFSAIEYALDAMWGVERPETRDARDKALRQLRKRGAAFVVAFLLALLALALQGLRTALAVLSGLVPGAPDVSHAVEAAISVSGTSIVVLFLYQALPAASIGWRDAVIGAIVTAALLTAGSTLVGWYLAHKSAARAWGDAGTVVLLLLWVHYSSQIFLLGAAYTGVRARASGSLRER